MQSSSLQILEAEKFESIQQNLLHLLCYCLNKTYIWPPISKRYQGGQLKAADLTITKWGGGGGKESYLQTEYLFCSRYFTAAQLHSKLSPYFYLYLYFQDLSCESFKPIQAHSTHWIWDIRHHLHITGTIQSQFIEALNTYEKLSRQLRVQPTVSQHQACQLHQFCSLQN